MARWDGIDEFVEVVETGSFTAAAEKLGVSKSFVSKQMKALEERFGTRLLQRTTRQMTLTGVGEVFFEQCKKMTEQYNLTESMVSQMQNTPVGTLKVALNASYGVRFMAEALAAFSSQHPQLAVEVSPGYQDVDMTKGAFDLSIRYGGLEDSSHLVARRLGTQNLVLCAAPSYLERFGVPHSVEALKDHNCLVGPSRQWFFKVNGQSERVRVDGSWITADGETQLAAARQGIGIVQLPDFFVHPDILSHRLVLLDESWARYSRVSWAVYPHSRHLSTKIRLFVDFLITHFARMRQEWTQPQITGISDPIVAARKQ